MLVVKVFCNPARKLLQKFTDLVSFSLLFVTKFNIYRGTIYEYKLEVLISNG